MSLKLSKHYLSWRGLVAATLLALTSPYTGLTNSSLFATPPTSVELAVFKEEDLVKILRDKVSVQKKYEDTDTHVQLDEKILTQKFKFYLDSKGDVRQQIGDSKKANDPKVVRLSVNAGSQQSYAEYLQDANPYGNSYFFEIVKPDGSLDRIQVQIPSGASQADIEQLIRDALLARGYTIGSNGSILFDGKPINRSLNDYVVWISGGGQGGGQFNGQFPPYGGGQGGGYFFFPGQNGGGTGSGFGGGMNGGGGAINYQGPGFGSGYGSGPGGFSYNGGFGFQDQGRYIGGANGSVFLKLPNVMQVFQSNMFDIVDNSKMNNDWIGYEFKLGDLTYKLEKMSIPGGFNDEWVILRKGEGDIWYLIKQDEHAALMEVLKNSSDPELKNALAKIDGWPRYLDKWDQSDYDNVRKHAMKYQPQSGFGFGTNVNFQGSYSGVPGSGGFGSGGGSGGGSFIIPNANNDIYTFLQSNPNASLQDIQAMLDSRYGRGMVIVSKDPSGNYQFQVNQVGPQGGPGQLSQFIIVQNPSLFNSGGNSPNFAGGNWPNFGGGTSGGQWTFSGGGAQNTGTTIVPQEDLAKRIREIFNSGSRSSSGSSASNSASGSRSGSSSSSSSGSGSGTASGPNSSSQSGSGSSSTTVMINEGTPILAKTETGEWRLTVPIPVDANKDGRVDFYDYEFVYLKPGDVDKDGKIKDSVYKEIVDRFKNRGIDFSRIVTDTTASGEVNGENIGERSASDFNKTVIRVFDSVAALTRAMQREGWTKAEIDAVSGTYTDAEGNQRAFSVGIDPAEAKTPEQLEQLLKYMNDAKNLLNPET